ncbi:tetratricopeptide repeat protein [Paracoccaceae bacterium]|nr:tetratricopeptide repeat protein [Paracoccaceae bacterium]
MELTIDQALQKGIEAHKAGKLQEADRIYTAILKAQPKHPDANHNMGVMAVGVEKTEAALPFFEAALDANPRKAQFWLSYIDALIKIDRFQDAKAVLDQAKGHGAKGDGFDLVESRLATCARIESDQTDEEILSNAADLRENGKYDKAIDILLLQTEKSPTDPNVLALLSHCYILNDDLDQAKIYLDAARNINSNIAAVGWNQSRLLLKKKNVDEALTIAEKTNELFPDDIEGMGVLGSCLRASGSFDESLKFLNKAIEINPNYAEAIINRGLIYLNKKDHANALTDLEKAHNLKPHIKQIWPLVLNLKIEAKDFENTISLAEEMIKLNPVDEKTFAIIASCYQHLDNCDQAVVFYKKAIALKADYLAAWTNLASAFKKQGKIEEAIEAYSKVLSIKPDYAEAYNNMGVTLQEQGRPEEAIEAYTEALSIKPRYAEALYGMGVTLQEQGKMEDAIEAYTKALSIKPDYAEAYNNMGSALADEGKMEGAIEAYNKALSIKPDYAEAYNNMGSALADEGKMEGAIEAYNKALSIKPDYAEAHRQLSELTKYTLKDLQISFVAELLQREELNDSDRSHLLYTYAKMQEDLGDLSAAFYSYVAGGDLRQTSLAYEFSQDEHLFAKIKNTAPQFKNISLNLSGEAISHTPIFILGMPRSGTTLVEQIVSSHTEVTGAGELDYVSRFGTKLVAGLRTPTVEAISAFRERYLAELPKRAEEQAFITDKMPQNFRFIALICAAFPEAKIIHVQRNAEATCWSNFKHYFSSKGLGYSYNLTDTVKYYGLYKNLMHFWFQSYSTRIYNLDYEKLTKYQETETRRLIKYLELNWQDACLDPQKNKRAVMTASQQQVRQKVYKGSSQAWRKYEPFLNDLFDTLEA